MIDFGATSGTVGSVDDVVDDCGTSEAAAALCGGWLGCSFVASARGLSPGAGVDATGATLGAAP
jgi:hypothetical protein